MTLMPTTEIINEIDAYLSRLRQARELLLDQRTEVAPKPLPRRKRKVAPGKTDPTSFRSRRITKNKSRSDHPVVHLNRETVRVENGALVPISATQHASDLEQPAIAPPDGAMLQRVVVKRLPSKAPNTSIRSVRHRTPKSNPGTNSDVAKPAIALAGPAGGKIVVVPAEQVRRERERAAQPEVRRPRVPASGLTGRLAFEALFK